MDASDYQISLTTQRPPAIAFDRIAAVGDWWTRSAQGQAAHRSDLFSVRFGDTRVTFQVSAANPGRSLVWDVVTSHLPWLADPGEWNGTQVVWTLDALAEGTRIHMIHLGLHPAVACFERCQEGWNFFAGASLSRYLDEGRGQPDREER